MLSPEEMAELWELEAPSIYGLAHARAEVLDSPTWSTPAMEDSESEPDSLTSTLGVPSSVPGDAASDGPGLLDRCELAYNLDLPCDIDLAVFNLRLSRRRASRKRCALDTFWPRTCAPSYKPSPLSLDRFIRLRCTALPYPLWSLGQGHTYTAPVRGLQNNTLRHELVVLALASLIRSMAPGHKFSSFTVLQNVTSKLHRDQRNLQGSSNLVFPFTYFLKAVSCGFSAQVGHPA